jgi:NADP-dependent 3-hydroxy acid dehydrogenase YdfG
VVVNNAGLSIPGHAWQLTPDEIAREIDVNLLGPMLVTRRALPAMIEARRGDVVFVTSDAARNARPKQTTYTATKAGLEGYARALSLELEGTGVRSTVVRPGPAASEYAANWDPETTVSLLGYWPKFGLQRHLAFMPAEAVARAVVMAVTTPQGVCFDTLEVQPVAPIEE